MLVVGEVVGSGVVLASARPTTSVVVVLGSSVVVVLVVVVVGAVVVVAGVGAGVGAPAVVQVFRNQTQLSNDLLHLPFVGTSAHVGPGVCGAGVVVVVVVVVVDVVGDVAGAGVGVGGVCGAGVGAGVGEQSSCTT